VTLHILLVDHTGSVSGAEYSLQSLIAGLQDAGVRCTLACPVGPNQALARSRGIEPWTITATEGSLALHPLRTLRAIGEIAYAATQVARLVRSLSVDLVHANSIRASLVTGLAARIVRRPTVAHLRDRLPPGTVSKASLRLIGATCAHVVANSRYTAGALEEAGVHVGASVIHNPVDRELFRPLAELERTPARARLGLDPETFALGVVGQITPWKGQDTALRAVAELAERHPRLRLLVVGEAKFLSRATRFDNAAYLEQLHELARDERLADRVDFLGERDDVPTIMGTLDALLVPSHGEPFGRVVVEAMAAGTPVVASDSAGPSEIIQHGVTGLLAAEGDTKAWAGAIERLITDGQGRRQLIDRGRERSADFSVAAHAERMLAVYRDVLAARP
jgi:glycosyltransferase involved in cell wall biosynthesis